LTDTTSATTPRLARVAPAAERNKAVILEALRSVLPRKGLVLEIASGTGQHVAHFAPALPGLRWQPSEPDVAMHDSIRAHIAGSGATGIAEPVALDTESEHWPIDRADAVLCSNMIHIAPWSATEGLMRGASEVLAAGAPLVLYGPFQRGGQHTAPSNEAFDASLRSRNPAWGVRDLDAVTALAETYGFEFSRAIEMPANNLLVIFIRARPGHIEAQRLPATRR
jgi:SAM-dependent methyltransferase